jgi:predicted ATPase/DNA-binding SARP family transcriptional activator
MGLRGPAAAMVLDADGLGTMCSVSGRKGVRPSDAPSSGEAKPVRIKLLGGFGVSVGPRTVRHDDWRLKKASDLVKLLALTPDHRLHRERISYLLWPTVARNATANNLRQAVHAARRALVASGKVPASAGYLVLEGELLALCPRCALWVDVDAFEAATAAARRSRDSAAYRAALNLYAGDLLPEDLYEEWAEERRESLRQDRLSLLLELAELHEEEGDLKAAADALHAVVTDEPAHEEAQVRLMRLYAGTGHRYGALRQYEALRKELRRRFGVEPDASSRRLREEIAEGKVPVDRGPQQAPPPRGTSAASPKHNIPAALNSFVGREREMAELQRALAMTRLLTLTGAGGTGKTRLATEAARELAGTYPDGAWMVDASALSDPELLTQAVAAVFGVGEQPEQPLLASLTDALRPKETLLVLDNCEHLIDACAHLSETLLGSCRNLRILATSRQALGIAGDVVWPVPPLSVPDPGRPVTFEAVASSAAALLFSDRAKHRRPDFALGPENARAVAEICRRLDGIPLAVELAAARVGVVGVEEVAERLGNVLGLLTGGSRTAAPRQRTLRATLQWSHDLLEAPERRLFARLSVFAGGWTLEAAEAVGSASEGKDGVLEELSGLVDKSLVVAEAAGAGAVRYGMLEPIRQYAKEHLEAGGEADLAAGRHAAYFLEQAEAAGAEMVGPHQQRWLDRLEREHDNLRVALGWFLERRDERCLRLGVALSRFWYTRGYLSEGRRWLEGG